MGHRPRMKTFLAIAFLILGVTAVNSLAVAANINPQSYTRIFYFRDGKPARESLFAHPNSIDILAPQSYSLNSSGKLVGNVKSDILAFAKKYKIKN